MHIPEEWIPSGGVVLGFAFILVSIGVVYRIISRAYARHRKDMESNDAARKIKIEQEASEQKEAYEESIKTHFDDYWGTIFCKASAMSGHTSRYHFLMSQIKHAKYPQPLTAEGFELLGNLISHTSWQDTIFKELRQFVESPPGDLTDSYVEMQKKRDNLAVENHRLRGELIATTSDNDEIRSELDHIKSQAYYKEEMNLKF